MITQSDRIRVIIIYKIINIYTRCLISAVMFFGAVSAFCIISMVAIVVIDVVLRIFRMPVKGAYDLIGIAGAITIATALPYTTAIKGHIAIEYFFQKFNHTGRLLIDSIMRLLSILFFLGSAWQFLCYGNSLKSSGAGTPTLQVPLFWLPWLMAVVFVVVALVIVQHLVNPNKEFIKP